MDVREAPLRLLIGHALIVLPYVVRTTLASLARLDPAWTEAAETLGASRLAAFRQIILPLIRPGVVAGMLFGFILSFDDVSVSLFLVDARTVTLPLAIMSYLQYNFDPSIAAISSMLIGLTVVVVVVVERRLGMKQLFTG
jgi:putative spermidine/putrescine transport system permease protein